MENEQRFYCPNCGNIIEKEQAFCNMCGEELSKYFDQTKPEDNFIDNKKDSGLYEEDNSQYLITCTECGLVYDKRFDHTCQIADPSEPTSEHITPQPPIDIINPDTADNTQTLVKCAKCGQIYDGKYPHQCPVGIMNINNSFFKKIVPGRTLSKYPDINNLKQSVNSWLFLVFLVLYSVNALVSFILAFAGNSNLLGGIESILRSFDVDYDINDMLSLIGADNMYNALHGVTILANLINLVPVGVVLYGLWTFYLSCIDNNRNGANIKGLRIIQLLYKVLFIVNIVFCLVLDILFIIAAVNAQDSFFSDMTTVFIVAILVVTLYYGLTILYYKNIISIIDSVCNTIKNKQYVDHIRVPKYLIIWQFVLCAGEVVNISFDNNIFSSMMTLATLILLNTVFIQFNKNREIAESPYKVVNPDDIDY